MNTFNRPITEVIRTRFSCRSYLDVSLEESKREQIDRFIDSLPAGPFGTRPRFLLVAASRQDTSSLRGLGTYGFIRNPAAFVIGAVKPEGMWLEDFGYLMEYIILFLTSLGLGTCWLGGSFTRSSFSQKISLKDNEHIPAVTAIGEYADTADTRRNLIRRFAKGDRRLPWEKLFFEKDFDHPLTAAGADQLALEMVQLAPSASNKQPWRVVRDGDAIHFFLQRTPGYRESMLKKVLGIFDLQRVDMGIAMCHFDLTMKEQGIPGRWINEEPEIRKLDNLTEYSASWLSV
jgi:Putative TM nitroreductase